MAFVIECPNCHLNYPASNSSCPRCDTSIDIAKEEQGRLRLEEDAAAAANEGDPSLLFSAGRFVARTLSKSVSGHIIEKQKKEIVTFIVSLAAMDGDELGSVVAVVADYRNKMLEQGINLNEPMILVGTVPGIIPLLSGQVDPLQQEERTFEALPIIVWVHSLRAASTPELRQYGRDLWGQLERGFKHVHSAADDLAREMGITLNTNGATEFPKGLTPKPLD